jgi:hypothetical protein
MSDEFVTTDMKPSKRQMGPRWLLLCLLLLGVVSMHHFVPPTHHEPAAIASMAMDPTPTHHPDSPAPSPAHDLLHLCMAVLGAALGLLLLVLLLLTPVWRTRTVALQRLIQRPNEPPGLSGRALLSSVCVLRL